MFKSIEEKPKKRQLCLCKCSGWNTSGLQVAMYDGKTFDYEDSPNDSFNEYVEGWLPLNDEGVPESEFELWFSNFKLMCLTEYGWTKESINGIDKEAHKEYYYDNNMSIQEAYQEELTNSY